MMRIGIAAVLGVGACAVPVDDLSSTEQDVRQCPEGLCGANSPRIDYQGFHELEKHGLENGQGLAITRFEKYGLDYTLDVTNNMLIGWRNGLVIAHNSLIGARIHVSLNGINEWVIRVASVGSLPYVVGAAGSVETYVLEYSRTTGPEQWSNVCGATWGPEDVSLDGVNTETFGQQPVDSILFDLDRVDTRRMRVNDVPDTNWFNIGCAGHTLSKLFLTHNMIASQGGTPGLHDARQATLKMLVADYFGDGTAFTVAGQRIDWQGIGVGGIHYFDPPRGLEARWSASGATCLSTPRMTRPSNDAGRAAFPNIEEAIVTHARETNTERPPPCRRTTTDGQGELRTSALR